MRQRHLEHTGLSKHQLLTVGQNREWSPGGHVPCLWSRQRGGGRPMASGDATCRGDAAVHLHPRYGGDPSFSYDDYKLCVHLHDDESWLDFF